MSNWVQSKSIWQRYCIQLLPKTKTNRINNNKIF